ncbi:MAG: hypothetical protein ABIP55_05335 [Tepidisphaeraceae bacterium]
MNVRHIVPALVLAMVSLGSCDRDTPAPATPAPATGKYELDLKPLTPLLPNRPTHIAADPLGNMYWVQESDRGDDTLFVIGEGDIPRATQLSAANIGVTLGTPGARGNIQALAAGPRGELYFYFLGVQGRRTVACLGQFHPKTSKIRLLADTDTLATAAGMGRSLPLARGSVVADGRSAWLWLRHSDLWSIFRFDPTGLAPDGPIKLVKPFDAVTLEGKPIEMTREDFALSSAGDGKLFLLDPSSARLLRIAPDGVASLVRSLIGLPSVLSTPALDDKGRLLIFASHSNPLAPTTRAATPAAVVADAINATFPSMLIFDADGRVTAIDRDHITAYPGFPVLRMRLSQLAPHPRESAWLSYDANSGEFLMLKIVQRDGF